VWCARTEEELSNPKLSNSTPSFGLGASRVRSSTIWRAWALALVAGARVT
jgi:hypothetical protein